MFFLRRTFWIFRTKDQPFGDGVTSVILRFIFRLRRVVGKEWWHEFSVLYFAWKTHSFLCIKKTKKLNWVQSAEIILKRNIFPFIIQNSDKTEQWAASHCLPCFRSHYCPVWFRRRSEQLKAFCSAALVVEAVAVDVVVVYVHLFYFRI